MKGAERVVGHVQYLKTHGLTTLLANNYCSACPKKQHKTNKCAKIFIVFEVVDKQSGNCNIGSFVHSILFRCKSTMLELPNMLPEATVRIPQGG
jgi:hypothetical protein